MTIGYAQATSTAAWKGCFLAMASMSGNLGSGMTR
eukprot:CAMPEP_0185768178 /NCGR_PEP_ID=MMETSP1174-20130828/48079_1 /TAXON_ID=35687 /ORGANISM="Dictyocha speculum, Strain CCMP1381" /LENGTH=34 /DNA_ID= /DNA_START= /DNA_END= /DNA_ORIENTATION=